MSFGESADGFNNVNLRRFGRSEIARSVGVTNEFCFYASVFAIPFPGYLLTSFLWTEFPVDGWRACVAFGSLSLSSPWTNSAGSRAGK